MNSLTAKQLFQASQLLSAAGEFTAPEPPEVFFTQLHQRLQANINQAIARLGHTRTRGHRRAAHLILLRDRLESQMVAAFREDQFNIDTRFRGLINALNISISETNSEKKTHSELVAPIFQQLREQSLAEYRNYLLTKKQYINAGYQYCRAKKIPEIKEIDTYLNSISKQPTDQKVEHQDIHKELEQCFDSKNLIMTQEKKVAALCDWVLDNKELKNLLNKYASNGGNSSKKRILETLSEQVRQIKSALTEGNAVSQYNKLEKALQDAIEANKAASGWLGLTTEFKDVLEGKEPQPGLFTTIQDEWKTFDDSHKSYQHFDKHRQSLKNPAGVYQQSQQFMRQIVQPSADTVTDDLKEVPPLYSGDPQESEGKAIASTSTPAPSIHQLSFRLLKQAHESTLAEKKDPEEKKKNDLVPQSSSIVLPNEGAIVNLDSEEIIKSLQDTLQKYRTYLQSQRFKGLRQTWQQKEKLMHSLQLSLETIKQSKIGSHNPEDLFCKLMDAIDDVDRVNSRLSGNELTATLKTMRQQVCDSVCPSQKSSSRLKSACLETAHARATQDHNQIHVIKVKKQWFHNHRERFFYKDPHLNTYRLLPTSPAISLTVGGASCLAGAAIFIPCAAASLFFGEPALMLSIGLMTFGAGAIGGKESSLRIYPGEIGNLVKEIPTNQFTYVSSVEELSNKDTCGADEMFLFVPDPRDQKTITQEGFSKISADNMGWPVFTTAASAADFLAAKAEQGFDSHTEAGWHKSEAYAREAFDKNQTPRFFSQTQNSSPASVETAPPSYT